MPRFVLIDAELDCVAGDTNRYFLRFLRTMAHARGEVADAGAVQRLTPARAAEVMDIIEGDAVGWRYVEHLDNWPGGAAGYEVYALPPRSEECPPLSMTSDQAVVRRVRSMLRRVAFVEKVAVSAAPEEPTREIDPEYAQVA